MFIREYDIREGLVARYKRPSISTQKLPFCTYHAYIIAGVTKLTQAPAIPNYKLLIVHRIVAIRHIWLTILVECVI